MKRTISTGIAVLASLALITTAAGPASAATTYGKPSGKWFEAIVTHEVGHCLGWVNHNIPASSSIMRPGQDVARIQSGLDTYKPISVDLTSMQKSRAGDGNRPTTYVLYPYKYNKVLVHNATGRTAGFTAADRWDPYTDFDIVSVTTKPTGAGISIFWDTSLAGTNAAGVAVPTQYEWFATGPTTGFWQILKCEVRMNPNVVG